MARAYDIAVAALALDVDRKWLDNLIAHHDIPGVERFDRGVSRRLTVRALLVAAAARDLQRELGVPLLRAVVIAEELLTGPHHRLELTPALSVHVDPGTLEREIERRLLHAMETVVPRRRGRPPRSTPEARRGTH